MTQMLKYLKETNPQWSSAFFKRLEGNRAMLEAVYLKELKKQPVKKVVKRTSTHDDDAYRDFLNSREHQDWILNLD